MKARTAPRRVKLHMTDGRVLRVNPVYDGIDPDGDDIWVVETQFRREDIARLSVGRLPRRACLVITGQKG